MSAAFIVATWKPITPGSMHQLNYLLQNQAQPALRQRLCHYYFLSPQISDSTKQNIGKPNLNE